MKIIFFGTPSFATHSLLCLINNGHDILAVVTSEDKKQGRGLKIKQSDIKEFALKKSIPVLQPQQLQTTTFIKTLNTLNADLFIVVAFRMLPEKVWKIPKYGTINLHSSLLPDYRGAAPINWAIINGENKTGVSTFFINNKIDSGDIILQKEINILKQFNVKDLHDKLMIAGGSLLVKTVKSIHKKTIKTVKQNKVKQLKKAPKITKQICQINWNNKVNKINNLIRGLSPYPGAWTTLNSNNNTTNLKIYRATPKTQKDTHPCPGKVQIDNLSLRIWGIDGYLIIHELQLSGKKRMHIKAFLNGFNLSKDLKVS